MCLWSERWKRLQESGNKDGAGNYGSMFTPNLTCSSPVLKFGTIGSSEKACAPQGNPALGWTRKWETDSWPLDCCINITVSIS